MTPPSLAQFMASLFHTKPFNVHDELLAKYGVDLKMTEWDFKVIEIK